MLEVRVVAPLTVGLEGPRRLLGTDHALFLDLLLASWVGSLMVCALCCHAFSMAGSSPGLCIPDRKGANICSVLIVTLSST